MTPSVTLAIPVATALATAALIPLARALARRTGAIDHPGDRKVHTTPMARLGGIAPALVFWAAAGLGFAALREPFVQGLLGEGLQDAPTVGPKLFGVLLGSVIAFTTGLIDDLIGSRFPFWAKALGQVSAASCVVLGGVSTSFMPSPLLNGLLTVFWLVGITNAFNLLDNMDGLSPGVALIASSVLLVNALSSGEELIAALTLAFIGVLAGFLFFNFSPGQHLSGRWRESLHRFHHRFAAVARPLRHRSQQFLFPGADAGPASRHSHHRHHHGGDHSHPGRAADLCGRCPSSFAYPGGSRVFPKGRGPAYLSDDVVSRALRSAPARCFTR